MLKYIFLSLSFFLLKVTCLFRPGACPSITYPNESFAYKNYIGRWYEVARMKNDTVERCIMDFYVLNRAGSYNRTITEYPNNELNTINGRASPTNNGFLFNGYWANSNETGLFFNEFEPDYNSFAVEYSCTNVPGGRNVFMYINFRRKNYNRARFQNILDFIKSTLNITPDLLDMSRKHCQ